MRTSGMMEYMTPRQMATASSRTPKSVMKTMVGGYFCAGGAVANAKAHRLASKSKASIGMTSRRWRGDGGIMRSSSPGVLLESAKRLGFIEDVEAAMSKCRRKSSEFE